MMKAKAKRKGKGKEIDLNQECQGPTNHSKWKKIFYRHQKDPRTGQELEQNLRTLHTQQLEL